MLSDEQSSVVVEAARTLAAGEVVAFPTETVYGLGADASNALAVARLYALKGRPCTHPCIVHILGEREVTRFARYVPEFAQRLMRALWPGPLTLILPRSHAVAHASAAGQDSIGLRVPSHPVALALLEEAQKLGVMGISAPSANRFGRTSPTLAQHVRDEFGDSVPVLDGGACAVGIESTIVDCTREAPVVLRPGMHTIEQLSDICDKPVMHHNRVNTTVAAPRAPGTLESHYAPKARLRLVSRQQVLAQRQLSDGAAAAIALFCLPADAQEAAHKLFATLRQLDAQNPAEIWVTMPPAGQEWDGVRDRLSRAAA